MGQQPIQLQLHHGTLLLLYLPTAAGGVVAAAAVGAAAGPAVGAACVVLAAPPAVIPQVPSCQKAATPRPPQEPRLHPRSLD
jgi:hypothetical protein